MQTIKKTQINAVIYEDATHNATLTGNLCLILIQYSVTNSNGRKGNYTLMKDMIPQTDAKVCDTTQHVMLLHTALEYGNISIYIICYRSTSPHF